MSVRHFRPILKFTLVIFVLLPLAGGCSFSNRITLPRSAWEQILSTEAIDRALAKIEWPEVSGRSVFVRLGAPGLDRPVPEGIDIAYLLAAVDVALVKEGAIVVRDDNEADVVMVVLVGAMGIDISGRHLGVKGSAGGFIPFTIPELPLYKRVRRQGFAKLEIALLDYKNGRVLHQSDPVQGTTNRVSTTYFFVFTRTQSDTSRLD
jgi:hypothetical protein